MLLVSTSESKLYSGEIMSEMKAGLLAQIAEGQEPDISPLIKKLCGEEAPVIDTAAERSRFKRDRLQEMEEALRAESKNR